MIQSVQSDYVKNLTTIVSSIFLFLTVLVIAIFPGVQETIQSVMENGENFQPIYVNVGDINVKWDVKFDLPEFQFNSQEFSAPALDLSLPFIILVVVVAVIIIVLSHIYPNTGFFATCLFGGLGAYFSVQTVEVYKNMLANGITSWDAANTCFGFLF